MVFYKYFVSCIATPVVAALALDATAPTKTANAITEFTPTFPGPGQSFRAGSLCTIQWTPGSEGKWSNVSIDLMSGSNTNMTRIMNVVIGLDGSSTNPETSYNWTCPKVQPYSAIYFYEFRNGEDPLSAKWTTRFTITSYTGEAVRPEFTTQENGDQVPWGKGMLLTKGGAMLGFNRTSSTSPSASSSVASHPNTAYRQCALGAVVVLISIFFGQGLCGF